MRQLDVSFNGHLLHLLVCNGFPLNVRLMVLFFVQCGLSGQRGLLGSSTAPYSVIVIVCDDDHRNMKGHISSVVTFEILFSLHLLQHDGVVRVMATCRILDWLVVALFPRKLLNFSQFWFSKGDF